MALLIKNLSAYKQLRPVALELRNAKDKAGASGKSSDFNTADKMNCLLVNALLATG